MDQVNWLTLVLNLMQLTDLSLAKKANFKELMVNRFRIQNRVYLKPSKPSPVIYLSLLTHFHIFTI